MLIYLSIFILYFGIKTRLLKQIQKLEFLSSFMKNCLTTESLILPIINITSEDIPEFSYTLLKNDWSRQVTKNLIQIKNLIAKGLPSMSKEHIVRLVMDTRHQSIVIKQKNTIAGVITFRVFQTPNIAQIAFLVVKYQKRIKGYGKKLINKLKSEMQKRNVEYLLTFGDQNALGFFRKQGFTQKLTLQKERWEGYIKEYQGGRFMQCKIYQKIDYQNIDNTIQKQKQYLIQIIKQRSINQTEFCGKCIPQKQKFQRIGPNGEIQIYPINPRKIPGVIEAGWTWEEHDSLKSIKHFTLEEMLQLVLKSFLRHPDSWPFRQPVTEKQAFNYFEVISQPMDIQKISEKLQKKIYQNEEQFIQDFELMFNNCKKYNSAQSLYYKIAVKLEEKYIPILRKLQEGVITASLKLL